MLPHHALFPKGKPKALTMSYDDGTATDRRLVAIFDRYSVRGAFHLNSGNLDKDGYLTSAEAAALFARHEISSHSVTHPALANLPSDRVAVEILDDRRALEKIAGYPVRGMSYPYGAWNEALACRLPALGIEYARTVSSTGEFDLPRSPSAWNPTCHHSDGLMERATAFIADTTPACKLMYVWGHSFDFDREKNWNVIEEFCAMMGTRHDIWFATNIEIIDYVNALQRLRFGADHGLVLNPSASPVWLCVKGSAVEIGAGKLVTLGASL